MVFKFLLSLITQASLIFSWLASSLHAWHLAPGGLGRGRNPLKFKLRRRAALRPRSPHLPSSHHVVTGRAGLRIHRLPIILRLGDSPPNDTAMSHQGFFRDGQVRSVTMALRSGLFKRGQSLCAARGCYSRPPLSLSSPASAVVPACAFKLLVAT